MIRHSFLIFLGLCTAALPALAAEKTKVPEGTWRIAVLDTTTGAEISLAILKVEDDDGKVKATVVASPLLGDSLKIKNAAIEGKLLKMVLAGPPGDWKLQAVLPGKGEKAMKGSINVNAATLPLTFEPTDKTELSREDAVKQLDLAPAKEIAQLGAKIATLRAQHKREKDADKAAELLNKLQEAEKEAADKAPKLLDEVLEKNADSPVALYGALGALKLVGKGKFDQDRVKKLVGIAEKSAAAFGPAMKNDSAIQIATVLNAFDGGAAYALEFARGLEKGLSDKDETAAQVRVLNLLLAALKKAEKTEEATALAGRIEKLDLVLDKEYFAKVPPFKAEKYEGRTSKSKRAVVMELFTGAQCPPCVAADVGFDALEKTYKPAELVLIQYHVHIPGPDPLANAESVERFEYYVKAHPGKIGGTPTTIFNGKPEAGGGGGMPQSKGKYDEFRKIIDPLLDSMEEVELTATASRKGNKIEIEAEVKGLKDADENKKLRFLLVEEAIRYVGGNNLRFHHQVVRTFPGGVEGFALKEKDSKQKASVDLDELRKKLTGYLDDYSKTREFPNPNRPLDLKHLKVIALVQDDKTSEILQAVEVSLGGE